ncbi:hypothetical protein ACFQMM_13000 [Saliphagus sp. GCM10025308]
MVERLDVLVVEHVRPNDLEAALANRVRDVRHVVRVRTDDSDVVVLPTGEQLPDGDDAVFFQQVLGERFGRIAGGAGEEDRQLIARLLVVDLRNVSPDHALVLKCFDSIPDGARGDAHGLPDFPGSVVPGVRL